MVDKNATNEHIGNLVSSFNNEENIYVNYVPNTSIKREAEICLSEDKISICICKEGSYVARKTMNLYCARCIVIETDNQFELKKHTDLKEIGTLYNLEDL